MVVGRLCLTCRRPLAKAPWQRTIPEAAKRERTKGGTAISCQGTLSQRAIAPAPSSGAKVSTFRAVKVCSRTSGPKIEHGNGVRCSTAANAIRCDFVLPTISGQLQQEGEEVDEIEIERQRAHDGGLPDIAIDAPSMS